MSASRPILPTRLCVIMLLVSPAGCLDLRLERDEAEEGHLPEAYTPYDVEQSAGPDRWWEALGSDELNGMMQEAFADNLTMKQIWARLAQARASVIRSESGWYPALDFDAGSSWTRTWDKVTSEQTPAGGGAARAEGSSGSEGPSPGELIRSEIQNHSLSLAAGYEVDLWGRIRSGREAALLDEQATRLDLESAAMTLAAQVAQTWVGIIEMQSQRELLNQQLESNRVFLELIELRFRRSEVSALDVFQQRQAVSEVESLIPLVDQQEAVLRNQLAVLLGKPPQAALDVGTYDLAQMPTFPETGLPADLLTKRPDVQASWNRLHASDWRVSEARADLLPAIRLTGQVGTDAPRVDDLFDNWFANLAAGLTAPLFDGFRRAAEVERTRAVVEERLSGYRLTILTAMREVEDALAREHYQHLHVAALEAEIANADAAFDQAGQRYLKGLNDYLPVLTSLVSTQRLNRQLVQARRDLLNNRVDLYRALGGSWPHDLESPYTVTVGLGLAQENTP